MNSSDASPKLPTWLFIVADIILLTVAVLLAYRSGTPMSKGMMLSIVAIVGIATLVCLVPLILRFEQQKNEALDDRQRALEALARTVSASAEQISIAASGLHEIADIAQRNLKQAEQLPHKLQEKIGEFQAQLSTAEDAEREEMERELLALRTTESERLESVSQRIAKSSAEWAKLETAAQQHLAAANEALTKLGLGTASAIGKAQAAAEQALGQARVEAARHVGDASGQATHALETAKTAALAELEAKLTAATTAAIERLTRALEAKGPQPERPESPADSTSREPASATPPAAPNESPPATEEVRANATFTSSTESVPTGIPASDTAKSDAPVPAVKKARKPRREATSASEGSPPSASPDTNGTPPASIEITADAPVVTLPEHPPVQAEKIPEVAPVAPSTSEPFSHDPANGGTAPTAPAEETPAASSEVPKAARKRPPARKPEPIEPALGLELDQTSPVSTSGVTERVITSDGATRLVVTAYIGIGNRLFIRGEGPGLAWDKGVALQFISIGKWRWETNDASTPIKFKLYKNDDLECAALGAQTLDPGHQQELTAAF